MTTKATFYHAGCGVCTDAETTIASGLDPAKYDVEIVNLGSAPERLADAESAGVKSVPALVIEGQPYHINFGASIDDLK
ncbi:MAG: thioredoxin family protein [Erythrobacter sp.]